jgi:hypothetical protein
MATVSVSAQPMRVQAIGSSWHATRLATKTKNRVVVQCMLPPCASIVTKNAGKLGRAKVRAFLFARTRGRVRRC